VLQISLLLLFTQPLSLCSFVFGILFIAGLDALLGRDFFCYPLRLGLLIFGGFLLSGLFLCSGFGSGFSFLGLFFRVFGIPRVEDL
jgi:hypothetical protein